MSPSSASAPCDCLTEARKARSMNRRPSRCSAGPSTRASTTSTRPMSTTAAMAKVSWAGPWTAAIATRSIWPPSCRSGAWKPWRIATGFSTSSWPGCRPTTSTSTCCTACRRSPGPSCATWACYRGPSDSRRPAGSGTWVFPFTTATTRSSRSSMSMTGRSARFSTTSSTKRFRPEPGDCITPLPKAWA